MQTTIESAPAETRTVQFRARDGFSLHGDLYEPSGPPRCALVIAPAMAVPRSYYAAFASHLAQHGALVLVPDYRGVGDSRPRSLRGMKVRLRDWAALDLEGALDFLEPRHVPLRFLGHSIGGQLFGALGAERVERAVLVAAQSTYHRHWPWPARARMLALWYLVVPGLSHALGYLPIGRLTGSGVDVPKGIGLDWTRWGRVEHAMRVDAALSPQYSFANFRGPLRAYAIMDDALAPPSSVARLLEHFEHAEGELRRLHPRELGVAKIGHFAPFRPKFKDTLWSELRSFLLA